MNFRRIEEAWRAGDYDIAIRLLKAMIFEAGLMISEEERLNDETERFMLLMQPLRLL